MHPPRCKRPTFDIDVFPRWETENLSRLCSALRQVEAVSTTGPRIEGEAIRPAVLVEREVMTWNTGLGRIDTMVGIPDAEGMPVDYEQLEMQAIVVTAGDTVEIRLAGLRDIVTSKSFAARRKDAEALPELRRLLDQQAAGRARSPEPGGGGEEQTR